MLFEEFLKLIDPERKRAIWIECSDIDFQDIECKVNSASLFCKGLYGRKIIDIIAKEQDCFIVVLEPEGE